MPTIGYAGMSHLGVVSAIAAASKGFTVIAFDSHAPTIDALDAGRLPINEPGLQALLDSCRERLTFTAHAPALGTCDIVYISQDVPTDSDGRSDLGPIEALLAALGRVLAPPIPRVILSQVPPGFTRAHLLSGRSLIYQVETLIFGNAVERAMKPERFIVGTATPEAGLPAALQSFLDAFGCPILVLRYENAELAKIAVNCFLVASVATTNMLAEVCEAIGGDWNEIAPTLRLDRRIGPFAYLKPGLGLAGGNLERDLATVKRLSEAAGTPTSLVTTWLAESAHRRDWPMRILKRSALLAADRTIAILGLAYKENTHSTKNSAGLRLAEQAQDACLRLYDPVVDVASIADRLPRAATAISPLDACRGADAVVVMTPWPQFQSLVPADLAWVMRGRVIVDPYGLMRSSDPGRLGFDYHTLGLASGR